MSDQDLPPYVVVERRGSGVVAFLWGTLVGAGVALLLAPKTGEETQQDLREGARRFKDGAEDKLTDIRGGFEDGYDRARDEVEDRVDAVRGTVRERQQKAEKALKAGKNAARKARSDLEARVAESKAAYKAALADGDEADPSEDGAVTE